MNFKKRHGVYRIVCIGGSTTQGDGLPMKWKFPYLLHQKLNAEFPGRFEVLNLGLTRNNTRDFIRRFDKASSDAEFGWRDLEPDLVILAPLWNDFQLALRADINNSAWGKLKKFVEENLSSRFALGHYIYLFLEVVYAKIQNRYYARDGDFFAKKIENEKDDFRSRLVKIIELWQGENAKIYSLLFPCLVEEEWSDDFLRFLLKKNYGDSKL